MPIEVIVALLSLMGTLAGSYLGIVQSNRLLNYRLMELERRMEKHNNLIERMAVLERDQREAFRRIDETRADVERLEETQG